MSKHKKIASRFDQFPSIAHLAIRQAEKHSINAIYSDQWSEDDKAHVLEAYQNILLEKQYFSKRVAAWLALTTMASASHDDNLDFFISRQCIIESDIVYHGSKSIYIESMGLLKFLATADIRFPIKEALPIKNDAFYFIPPKNDLGITPCAFSFNREENSALISCFPFTGDYPIMYGVLIDHIHNQFTNLFDGENRCHVFKKLHETFTAVGCTEEHGRICTRALRCIFAIFVYIRAFPNCLVDGFPIGESRLNTNPSNLRVSPQIIHYDSITKTPHFRHGHFRRYKHECFARDKNGEIKIGWVNDCFVNWKLDPKTVISVDTDCDLQPLAFPNL